MMQPHDPKTPEQIEAEAQLIETFIETMAAIEDTEAQRTFAERFYVKRRTQVFRAEMKRRHIAQLEMELRAELADIDEAYQMLRDAADAAERDLEPEYNPITTRTHYDR